MAGGLALTVMCLVALAASSVTEEKVRFVFRMNRRTDNDGSCASALAGTRYVWLRRYRERGPEGLGQTIFQRDRRFWKIVVRPFTGYVNS
jgi:hypothetical protein